VRVCSSKLQVWMHLSSLQRLQSLQSKATRAWILVRSSNLACKGQGPVLTHQHHSDWHQERKQSLPRVKVLRTPLVWGLEHSVPHLKRLCPHHWASALLLGLRWHQVMCPKALSVMILGRRDGLQGS